MKVSNLSNLILFGLILTIPAVGCRKKPGFLTPLPGARAGQVPEPGPAPSIGQGEKPLGSEGLTGIKHALRRNITKQCLKSLLSPVTQSLQDAFRAHRIGVNTIAAGAASAV